MLLKLYILLPLLVFMLSYAQEARSADDLPTLIHTANYDPQKDVLIGSATTPEVKVPSVPVTPPVDIPSVDILGIKTPPIDIPPARTPPFDVKPITISGPKSGPYQANATGAGLFVAGGVIQTWFLHIDQIVEAQLSAPEIQPYFKDKAFNSKLSGQISDYVNNVIFKNGLNNASSIQAVKYMTDRLISTMISKIMASQNIPNDRASKWERAIQAPIDTCISRSASFFQAKHCVDVLTPDAVKNVQLGVVYEVASKTMDGLVPDATQSIMAKATPPFKSCIQSVVKTNKNGFNNCVNTLIQQTGDMAVQHIILTNPIVATAIKSDVEKTNISNTITAQFNTCIRNNLAKGIKDSDGFVTTTNCQTIAKNMGVYYVALAMFRQNIIEDLGQEKVNSVFPTGKNYLDSCWMNGSASDSELNQCLRKSISFFTTTIAGQLLNKQIPAALASQEPSLKSEILGNLSTCMNRNLPSNVLSTSGSSAGLSQSINKCSGATIREAAMKVATFTVLDTSKGNVSDKKAQELVDTLVNTQFSQCLGPTPNTQKLNDCIINLKKDGAEKIAPTVFFEQFTLPDTLASKMGLSKVQQEATVADVLANLDTCLEKNVNLKNIAHSDTALNTCLKIGIKEFALNLGDIEYNKEAGPYFIGHDNDKESYKKDFEASLSSCIDKGDSTNVSISDYVKSIGNCSTVVVKPLTEKIANYFLAQKIDANLPIDNQPADIVQTNLAARSNLKSQLAASFHTCLSNIHSDSTAATNACTDDLQRQGTYLVAIQTARNETKKTLNAPTPLKAEIAMNTALKACLDKAPGGNQLAPALDLCTKSYVIGLGKFLGETELDHTLAGALGTTTYQKLKGKIHEERVSFDSCMDQVAATSFDSTFMDRVTACANTLESDAIKLLSNQAEVAMISSNDTPESKEVKIEASQLIPCLAALAPSTPFSESSVPVGDGIFNQLCKTIGAYIDYDANKAGNDIQSVMQKLVTDFQSAGPDTAKQNLITNMSQSGMMDQLLKSIIRSNIQDTFNGLPKGEIPAKLQAALLDKKNFDAIFDANTIAGLRQTVNQSIFVPMVVQGKPMDSPEIVASENALKQQIAGILLRSPHFGDTLLQGTVQGQIDSMNFAVKFFAGLIYGKNSLNWSKVRLTPKGQAAEDYIRQNIMTPEFNGVAIPKDQMSKIEKQAQKLVTDAVESYSN